MTYVKTYLPTLKTHVANLKRDAKDLSRDLQRLAVRGELRSKTLYCQVLSYLSNEKTTDVTGNEAMYSLQVNTTKQPTLFIGAAGLGST